MCMYACMCIINRNITEKAGVLLLRIVKSNVSSVGLWFLSDEGATLETLEFTIRIGNTPTFLYFDLYLYTAYAAHYVYFACVYTIDES